VTGIYETIKLLSQKFSDEGFSGTIALDAPLAPLTWYKIGGSASILVEAHSVTDLALVKKLVDDYPLPFLVMGAGSNILVSDEGFPGLVLRLGGIFASIDVNENETRIRVGAAVPLLTLIREGVRIGLDGIERLAGIPGSVGGAIFMNAGTYGDGIGGLIETVDIFTSTGELETWDPLECGFEYRSSRFQATEDIVLSAVISGQRVETEKLSVEIERRLDKRKITQPIELPSCGCVFRNPDGDKSAARLMQDAGLKGERSGDAVISSKHTNFIVNEGTARARDVINLMAKARKRVYALTGIKLTPEVRAVGFKEPLEVMLDAWKED
jgi:UDP-N-acetylmuramate dehydrogenase